MRNVDLLKAVDIFAQVSEEDLQKVSGLLKEKRVGKDTIVFRQGDPGDALYLVQSGRVKATAANPAGLERELGFISEGQYFGELALVTGEPRSATMIADTDTRLLLLRKDDFDDFLALNVHVMLQTMKAIAQRQAATGARPAPESAAPAPRTAAVPEKAAPAPRTAAVPEKAAPEPPTPSVPEKAAPEPQASSKPEEDVSDLQVPREPSDEDSRPLGKVFTVFSPKGGAGKSTVATNLAVALAHDHRDAVVLLDLSLTFGHASLLLNLAPRSSLSATTPEAVRSMDLEEDLGYYLTIHPRSSLRVMVGATRPEDGETVTGDLAKAAVEQLRRRFDYVVVDTESYFSDAVLLALELSDRILILSSPEITALRDARECQRIFHEVVPIPRERILYLMNSLFPFKVVSKEQFEDTLQQPLFAELPYSGDGPAKAALKGEAFVDVQSGSPLARSIQRLAAQLAPEKAGSGSDRRRGFFR